MPLEIFQFKLKNIHIYFVCYTFLLSLFFHFGIVTTHAQAKRITDPAILESGKNLYQENCAVCHGDKAQGTVEDWQIIGDDGKYPPPPLNGSAHAWHHPIKGLAHTIRTGTLEMGGSMPGWKDKLSDDEIFAIIVWISSLWPDELYEDWMKRNVE